MGQGAEMRATTMRRDILGWVGWKKKPEPDALDPAPPGGFMKWWPMCAEADPSGKLLSVIYESRLRGDEIEVGREGLGWFAHAVRVSGGRGWEGVASGFSDMADWLHALIANGCLAAPSTISKSETGRARE